MSGSITDLYSSSKVIIVNGTGERQKSYNLPKELLVHASDYFAAALNGHFKESIEQRLEFDYTAGAFDAFVQYLYVGNINLPEGLSYPDTISILLEFFVIAEKFLVNVLPAILEKLKAPLKESSQHLKKEHVRRAVLELPSGHPVRKLFAQSVIPAYLLQFNREPTKFWKTEFDFTKELEELEGFAADILKAHSELALHRKFSSAGTWHNPITGQQFYC